jgi:hypothetical protein
VRELLRTKYSVMFLDEESRVLRRTRNEEPFASLADLEAEYASLLRAMNAVDRPRYGQLIDARRAPPRNDPDFEATVARYHEALYRGFVATAVLVRSAVGKLHVRRMLDASGLEAGVFHDDVEALRYLAEALASS